MDKAIRSVLSLYAKLPLPIGTLGDDDDLYQAGLTSHANVNVMLALEEQFGVEFPESLVSNVEPSGRARRGERRLCDAIARRG